MDPAAPFETEITDLAFGGSGVGRRDGKAVFVPGALPGERVRARVVAEHGAWTRAVLVEVLRAAPGRVEPACPLARRAESDPAAPRLPCPGCAYQHLRYEDELAAKGKTEELEAIRRISNLADIHFVWQRELNGLAFKPAAVHSQGEMNDQPGEEQQDKQPWDHNRSAPEPDGFPNPEIW